MPVVSGNRVTFPKSTKFYAGEYGTAEGALTHMGLLGDNTSLTLNRQMRRKMDRYPEVVVAETIQSEDVSGNVTVREWTRQNLTWMFGLHNSDTTEVAGGDTAVTDEAITLNTNGVGYLKNPFKSGTTPTVSNAAGGGATNYVANTDYVLIPRDAEGRSMIYRLSGGAIASGATVYVDYTWTAPQYREIVIGNQAAPRYFTCKFEETATNGTKTVTVIHKCRLGMNGAMTLNAPEGKDIPFAINGIYDDTANGGTGALMTVREYEA
ncbi:hypothetical protein [Deinococcus cellulosilyticus]|uniref:Uncharacterized protein n=1 Tax=Deinococcus cellulosilyticus (strain DSM 18568 / NBRC 106333 / KACC 11606 / 5516J-15) TaxID=1223518 RepID=A0A511N2Y5_DEIC1|nr:hypothetical protein [Deinococcus cellulosilyticus]GEM47214.1 hypothetical protein DC3_28490 [Deinococcus cellulosilyticus NBRC 106333 = KACC 11606]